MEKSNLTELEKEGIEVEIKYAGFVKRQQAELNQMEGQHKRKLPAGLDYQGIGTLSMEAREKLAKVYLNPLLGLELLAICGFLRHSLH